MMWIDGVSPLAVLEAIIAASIALFIFGIPAARLQQRYSPILEHSHGHTQIDWIRVGIVGLILVLAIATNITINIKFTHSAGQFPFIGAAVWVAILASVALRRPDWEVLPETIKGSIFLLSLVLCASMMPVEKLPVASWPTAFGLGFLSSVFDNIPLTALALKQGGYDWGFLAYAVGFGGSMIWFGSSAGVALSNLYPEAKSVALWIRHGWFVILAYVLAFFAMLAVWKWKPDLPHRPPQRPAATAHGQN
jgi:Na+/H+ antiporter NhaD/arsenite permease-like protein